MNERILIVEDEPGLLLTISDRLTSEGYNVESAETGHAGFKMVLEGLYDLIILDINLPGKNGFDICRDMRGKGINTPVLMLTARGEVIDRVLGLKLGADDYLTKPFEMIELLARIEALLRRNSNSKQQYSTEKGFHFADIYVDFEAAEVFKNGEKVELLAQEYRLLRYMIENRGKTVSREELLSDVWDYNSAPTTRTVDVHIAWLRQKLEPNPKHPRYLITVHRLGYKFISNP
ncbi:MAG: response regulator transcription factor [Deltaproteobacteria bacterium]|nr:response regulator transcription factor [Deltaproteobacteria bacterium]